MRLGGQCQPFKAPLPSGHRQPWAAYGPCSPLLPCGRVRGLGRLKPTLLSPQTDTQPRPLAAVRPWAPRAPRAFPPQDLRLLLLPKCPPPPSNVPSRLPIRSRPTPSPQKTARPRPPSTCDPPPRAFLRRVYHTLTVFRVFAPCSAPPLGRKSSEGGTLSALRAVSPEPASVPAAGVSGCLTSAWWHVASRHQPE